MVNFTMLTYRRPRLTKQALDSLGDTSGMTCMIRDQFSQSETWDIVEAFSEKNAIKGRVVYHALNPAGTGEARNDVIKCSAMAFGRGDYLYLSDNDVYFNPGWLETLIERYEQAWKYGFRIMGGYNHPYHQQAETCVPGVKEVQALALQSIIMRWSVWDQYGPFDETAPGKVCQGEDTFFAHRITADGYKLGVVDPPLLVNTGITNSFGEKIPGWELVKAQVPDGVIAE